MKSARAAALNRKFSTRSGPGARVAPPMSQPPLPGTDGKKPARITISVPRSVKDALTDLVDLYEQLRALEKHPDDHYMWTESRLIHSLIRAQLTLLGEQMGGIDLLNGDERRARKDKILAEARKDAEREHKRK